MQSKPDTRIDHDSLGPVTVPKDAFYGAQTQRALNLFPISGASPLAQYPLLIEALLLIKKAAAKTNAEIGLIPQTHADAICSAIDKLIADDVQQHFPFHSFHGGGGITANMAANELITNLANLDYFSAHLGSNDPVHPNEHVNLNQSTNDCLATACHIAVRTRWRELESELQGLCEDLRQFGQKNAHIPKLARTCLQDAVDISSADYFHAVACNLTQLCEKAGLETENLKKVNLGGGIIGRTVDCDPRFFDLIIKQLNADLTDFGWDGDLCRADNLFAASQAHNSLQAFANGLDQISRTIIRFCKDLRLMASGPESGLNEISLPAVQPGSSAIPGKINPTIPEFAIQCAMMACGRAHTINMTQDHGELDYNPYQMLVVIALFDMIDLLKSALTSLRQNCVQGLLLNSEQNEKNADSLVPSLMKLKREHGYHHASNIAKEADGDVEIVRRALSQKKEK